MLCAAVQYLQLFSTLAERRTIWRSTALRLPFSNTPSRPKIALKQNGGVCEHPEQVWNELKRLLDFFQEWTRLLWGSFHADGSEEGGLCAHSHKAFLSKRFF